MEVVELLYNGILILQTQIDFAEIPNLRTAILKFANLYLKILSFISTSPATSREGDRDIEIMSTN